MPKILVVDDERNIRMLVEKFLEEKNFEVEAIVSAEEAFELLRTNEYDLVATDIKLPGKSGIELIRELRNSGETVPILIISAYAKPEVLSEAFKYGNVDFLSKPFTKEELFAKIQELLEKPKESFDRFLREANESLKNNDLNRAEKLIKQMFLYMPSSPIPHYLMCELLKKRGNNELAQKHLNAAKALDPKYADKKEGKQQ
ncbi:response regulator [Thermosipho ferrireducens]|uniref:Response regulator n=1 Tax=Thermosipho ferrireducens TaxID=2571116 RepID=A0ABX7S6T5_9BACT|nr:response regulator [Thermosipho ferrireducens]QTA37480.1 response regulator [Thermosipho ferrireducens]